MIEIILSGFFFLFIIVTNIVSGRFGYETFSKLDPDAQLQKIGDDPKKFKIGIALALIEHASVIALTILLFIAFSSFNLTLGIFWLIFRTAEGLIQFINEPNYYRLLKIAKQYSNSNEKDFLKNEAKNIFKTKDQRFKIAMICWSIGTLVFSIVLVISEIIPELIGYLGIIASILVGSTTTIKLVKPKSKDFTTIGGLTAILFEVLIGIALIYYSII